MSQMFFQLLSKYGVGKFLSWVFLSYFLAHAREIFHSFKMNDDNFCSSCSHIFLTRVENRIIVYNLLGLLSHIFDRSEIVSAEHVLEMIDRSSFKILKHTGKLSFSWKNISQTNRLFSDTKNIICSI